MIKKMKMGEMVMLRFYKQDYMLCYFKMHDFESVGADISIQLSDPHSENWLSLKSASSF